MGDSLLGRIALVDVFNGELPQKVTEGIALDAINPDRFRACFQEYDDVLVSILKVSGVGEMGFHNSERHRDYVMGQQDLAKIVLCLSTMEGSARDEIKTRHEATILGKT